MVYCVAKGREGNRQLVTIATYVSANPGVQHVKMLLLHL